MQWPGIFQCRSVYLEGTLVALPGALQEADLSYRIHKDTHQTGNCIFCIIEYNGLEVISYRSS